MPTQILMPALSPTMEEGTLARWLVKEGQAVKSGDVMAEIETDKATMAFEAVDEGVTGTLPAPDAAEAARASRPTRPRGSAGRWRKAPSASPSDPKGPRA